MKTKFDGFYEAEQKFVAGWKRAHRGEEFRAVMLSADDPAFRAWELWFKKQFNSLPWHFREAKRDAGKPIAVVHSDPTVFEAVFNAVAGAEGH